MNKQSAENRIIDFIREGVRTHMGDFDVEVYFEYSSSIILKNGRKQLRIERGEVVGTYGSTFKHLDEGIVFENFDDGIPWLREEEK